MKPLLFVATLICTASLATAQVSDTARSLPSSRTYGTDSVKQGQEIYNGGGKSRKSKSNGDTLSRPRSNSKSGSMSTKPHHAGKK